MGRLSAFGGALSCRPRATAPGDSIFYRLVLVNEGSGLAKSLTVVESLPDALEFVNSDPSLNPQDAPGSSQRFTWRVAELGKDEGRYSFREWRINFTPRERGQHTLMSRALNRLGETQPLEPLWNPAGYLRNVVEPVKVEVV